MPYKTFLAFITHLLLIGANPLYADTPACEQHIHTHLSDDDSAATLENEMFEYQKLIEESLVYRSQSIEVAKKLKTRIESDLPLSGADLHVLNDGIIAHLDLREKLYRFAEMHECWLDLPDYPAAEPGLSPYNRLQGIMLSLSAALTLYDNYLLAISIFEHDDKLRRILNSEDIGYSKSMARLAEVTLSYNSINNRQRVRRAIHYYEEKYKQLISRKHSASFSYLHLLITQSPSYKLTREYAPFRVLGNKLRFLDALTNDTLISIRDEGINMFSMLFGNAVGLIENRKGKLHKNEKTFNTVRTNLQAGDILLEKTPFRLTDKFIPGHWGHAAVWIGDETELRSLGIWRHPLVRKYHRQIRQGNAVVEALRSGVVLSPLKQFMNIDDLGILRPTSIKRKEKANIILLALRQLGKQYDFNFDIESTDRIVCSELIYIAYTGIDWPTDNTLGRYTISPDNIAIKALEDGPLELVMLIHDGKPVKQHAHMVMAELLDSASN